MKIQQILNKMDQDVTDAYTVVEEKGGEVPQDRTLENLPTSVSTIPQAHYPEYGRVAYYPTRIGYEASGYEVTVNSINETKLSEFFELYPPEDMNYIEFMFEPEWDPETGDPIPGTGSWKYYWEEGELEISQADFTSTTGIDCTITSEYGYGQITISQTTVPDTEADLLYAEFASAQQFNAYTPNATTYTGTIGEATVQANCIKEVEVGTEITSLPHYFMAYTSILDTIDFSQSHVTAIGNYFLTYSINYNQPIDLPECSSIGTYFLQNASHFNQTVSLPNVTAIPSYFMRYCTSFNQPISLTGVTTIGTDFLGESTSFNKSFTIPATVSSIGNNFLRDCNAMVGTVTIETPVTAAQTPSTNFYTLSNTAPCYTTGITFAGTYGQDWFNKHVPLDGPSTYRKILGYSLPTKNFILSTSAGVIPMAQADVANLCNSGNSGSNITFADGTSVQKSTITQVNFDYTITTVGDYFCNALSGMTTLTMPNAHLTSVGINFLSNTNQLNSRIDVSGVTNMPTRFLAGCRSENIVLPASISSMGDYALSSTRVTGPLSIEVTGTIGSNVLNSAAFLADGCNITITGTCPSIGNYFLYQCSGNKTLTITLPPALGTIGTHFMASAQLTPTLSLPNTVTSIGDRFLYNVSNFNSPLTLPSSLTTIGSYFMYGCGKFNQPMSMPQGLTSVGAYFMYACNNFTQVMDMGNISPNVFTQNDYSFSASTSSAPMYVSGFLIKSSDFATFHNRFGDKTSRMYRKLVEFAEDYIILANSSKVLLDDITALNSASGSTITVDGQTINKSDIVEVNIGKNNYTSLGDNFCKDFTSLTTLALPKKINGVGINFLRGCTSFNQAISTFTSQLRSFGKSFMRGCTSFNQPLAFSSCPIISSDFLAECSSFNNTISWQYLIEQIQDGFLQNCTSYNQPTGIWTYWHAFRQSGESDYPKCFLCGCSSFNQQVTFSSNALGLDGAVFLEGADSFCSDVILTTTSNGYVLDGDRSFTSTNPNSAIYTVGFWFNSSGIGQADVYRPHFSTRTTSPYRTVLGFNYGASSWNTSPNTANVMVGESVPITCNSQTAGAWAKGMTFETSDSTIATASPNPHNIYGALITGVSAGQVSTSYRWNVPQGMQTQSGGATQITVVERGAYGIVTHYPVSEAWEGWADGGETVTLNQATFLNFVEGNGILVDTSMDPTVTADYQQDWEQMDPETGEGPYVWMFQTTDSQYIKVQPEDLTTTTGISITLSDPTTSNRITLFAQLSVDRTAQPVTKYLRANEIDTFSNPTATMEGKAIPVNAIASFSFGRLIRTVPANFLTNVEYYDETTGQSVKPQIILDTTNATAVTSIGSDFCANSNISTQAITFPACSYVQGDFMKECTFNAPVTFDNLTSIYGSYFLAYCPNFNSAVSLPKCTSVGESFMEGCTVFNSALSTPKLKNMNGNFLKGCTVFNQPLSFAENMETVSIGFLNNCTAFNQDLYFPSTLKGFSGNGTQFMYACTSMVSTVTWDVDPNTMYNKNAVSSAFCCNSATAACYVQGIKVAGTKAAEAMTLWPNSTRMPYRNLIAA